MKKILAYTFIILAALIFLFKILLSVTIALGYFLLWFIPIALIVAAILLLMSKKK